MLRVTSLTHSQLISLSSGARTTHAAVSQHKNEKDDEEEIQIEEDQFLHQIENTMLNNITLHGVEGIHRVFMMEQPKTTLLKSGVFMGKSDSELEWTLETDGTT